MNYLLLNIWSGNRLNILILVGIMVCLGPPTIDAAENDSEESMMHKLFELHSRLASQGNLESITRLGFMYERGEGVVKNRNKAIDLYEFAANRGYQPAIEYLANINAKKTSKSNSANSMEGFRVPVPKRKVSPPKTAKQKQKKPEDHSQKDKVPEQAAKEEQDKVSEQAVIEEQDKVTQSKQIEDENQKKLQDEIEKVQEAQEQLAKERARAEAAHQEMELIQKKRENELKEQQALANKTKAQNQAKKQSHAKLNNPEKTKFSSNPCNTPAAKFMSTCN